MVSENSPTSTFGSRLRKARKSINKTQQEFADMAGVAVTTFGAYESGEIEPGVHKLSFLLEYKISIDWLIFGDDYLSPEQKLIQSLEQNLLVAEEKIELLRHRNRF